MTDLVGERSEVEAIKAASAGLRGALAEDLEGPAAAVSAPSEQLLKFHGVYAQDDRDLRRARAEAGEDLAHIYMVRVAIPGGHLRAAQWRALDALADEVANGTIRLTTRQAVQFHAVAKAGLRPLARSLDARLMTSFGACGDVVRNTVMCPSLELDHAEESGLASRLAARFKPATRAHWEIFVGGERVAAAPEVEHQFYGATYLPRKFKIALAHPDENCVDVLAQDVGLVALGEGRYAMAVGGGLGRSYAHPTTFARLGQWLSVVTREEIDEVLAAVITTYRDLGDRGQRRRARMKYVVADLGLDGFRAQVESRLGRSLEPVAAVPLGPADDHLGWRVDPAGGWRLGLRVAAGRVADRPGSSLRSALAWLARDDAHTFLITPQQDVVIAGIAASERAAVEAHLRAAGVAPVESLGLVERSALACPALPTCGQALTEAERRLPDAVSALESALAAEGVRRPLQLRLTGCPNGCARAAVAEVGVVGRTKSTYDLYVGGGPRGDRLAAPYREKVKLEEVGEALRPLIARWRDEGHDGEAFGDFCHRVGVA